jgi:PAS domain S-box-containing protein
MWKTSNIKPGLLVSLVVAIGLIFTAKNGGWLQSGEWIVLDLFFQLRPPEPIDRRIVIVTLTEEDIEKHEYPISDKNLAILLNKIKRQNPVAIGLDIYRNKPVGSGYKELVKVFETTPNLIGIQNLIVQDKLDELIPPPPVLKELGQISSVDALFDGDRKIRRSVLYPAVEGSENVPNLGLALALIYLDKQGVTRNPHPNDFLRLNETTIIPLKENDGGYSKTDAGGYQVLTNYRGAPGSFLTVNFTDVLTGKILPNLMTDKIVLVGVSAKSGKDFFFTPYSQNFQTTPDLMTGVEVVANIASQVIASVLDNRPLFWFLPEHIEDFGTLFLTAITVILIWLIKSSYNDSSAKFLCQLIFIFIALTTLTIGVSYLAFLSGLWLPVFLPVICIFTASLSTTVFIYIDGIKVANKLLKNSNKLLQSKQAELEGYSYILKEKTLALQESEAKLILALDAAITGIWIWDLIEGEVYIQHNCERLLGINEDSKKIDFDDFLELVYPEDSLPLATSIDEIANEDLECYFEFRVEHKLNRRLHWLAVKAKVDYDPSIGLFTKMLGTISDITQRKSDEKANSANYYYYRALTQNSFDVCMLLNKNLVVCFISNPMAMWRVLGYEEQEVSEKSFTSFIYSKDVSFFINSIKEKLIEPESILQLEYRCLHKDGSLRVLESVIWNQLHKPHLLAFVINSRDITEYKNIKKSLRDIDASVERLMEKDDFSF